MNPLSLVKTIAQNYFIMTKRAKAFGESVHWTDAEAHQFLDTLQYNPLMQNRFAIAANNKIGAVVYHFNLDKYVTSSLGFGINAYYRLIQIDYLEDYIKWGEMVYQYADKMRDVLAPMKQSFRISIPMKLKDGHYHWVLMEAYGLQFDAQNNLISHLNIYTILSRFNEKEKIPLVGDMWDSNAKQQDWTHELWKKVVTHRAFVLTHAESQIVEELNKNSHLTNEEIGVILNKSKFTIDGQSKKILARARDAFGNQFFMTTKDVVQFLQERAFFQEQLIKKGE